MIKSAIRQFTGGMRLIFIIPPEPMYSVRRRGFMAMRTVKIVVNGRSIL